MLCWWRNKAAAGEVNRSLWEVGSTLQSRCENGKCCQQLGAYKTSRMQTSAHKEETSSATQTPEMKALAVWGFVIKVSWEPRR
ncbi:hypothetical protein EYF80_006330 [Liparis tanakae]|uniref:Uncharacterized protein n=1 Tax=Liparis tanakae TaxID=230148 RepID=A0A4Z2IZC9_9TELE|nr:hypothetical protein EYF80_006330 [Liparis tanakae]